MTDVHKPMINCPKKYSWAVNPIKLNLAYTQLTWEKENNPETVIDEKSIKEKYVSLKGLLTSEAEANLKQKRPRSTSNVA